MENIMTKDMIILGLEASSKEEAIGKLARVFEKHDKLSDYNDYIKQVLKREEHFPTAIGFGVATPHAKCASVREACSAFARLKNEIQWSKDEKVKYIFLFAVPDENGSSDHLRVLARLSRKIMREEFRKKLEDTDDIDEIYKILTE
jgi:fructose-specific phosphotransferase system IIA component